HQKLHALILFHTRQISELMHFTPYLPTKFLLYPLGCYLPQEHPTFSPIRLELGFFLIYSISWDTQLYCCCCCCCQRRCCKRSPSTSRLLRADSYSLVSFSSGGIYSCSTKCSG